MVTPGTLLCRAVILSGCLASPDHQPTGSVEYHGARGGLTWMKYLGVGLAVRRVIFAIGELSRRPFLLGVLAFLSDFGK